MALPQLLHRQRLALYLTCFLSVIFYHNSLG